MSFITASLAPFFQEYDLEQLDQERSAHTIIERTMTFGNRAEIHWLFSCYSFDKIREWVQRWGAIALSEPHRSFWRLFLGLEEQP